MMLSKQLNLSKWVALIVLVIGVSLVQLSGLGSSSSSTEKINNVVGLISALLACCSSGAAEVYFEKVLKGSNDVSVWVRHIELALIGIFAGLAGVFYNDAEIIRAKVFFHGYSTIILGFSALQALGGIVVALVVKYADNLLKGFATSISIIIPCLISFALFGEIQFCYYL